MKETKYLQQLKEFLNCTDHKQRKMTEINKVGYKQDA
jgi:hypothetical protein